MLVKVRCGKCCGSGKQPRIIYPLSEPLENQSERCSRCDGKGEVSFLAPL